MKKLILLTVVLTITYYSNAKVDTVAVFSVSMKKNINCVVIKPEKYKAKKSPYPALYLLHGYSGSYRNWITKVPALQLLATQNNMLIICPDADFGSWYLDSPVDSNYRYETFTGIELSQYVDANYNTIKSREGRAISGLSMGGFGALFIAFRHNKTFGACGSMSGALLLEEMMKSYAISKLLGDTIINRKYYTDYSINKVIENYSKDSLAIIIDCGIDDNLKQMSKTIHDKMFALKIPHDYTERPGKHDWNYWANAVQYQILFFRNYFNRIQH